MFYDFATVFQLTTMHRSLIMALLFMLPLTRRKRFWGRFCAGAAVCLLLVPLLEAGAAFRRIWTGRAFQAVYGAICVYLTVNKYGTGGSETLTGKTLGGANEETIEIDQRVNHAIPLKTNDDFYLPGFTLIGWSKVKKDDNQYAENEYFTLDALISADNIGMSVENSTANTLYAVWEPKTYTVTVNQVMHDDITGDVSYSYNYSKGKTTPLAQLNESVTKSGDVSVISEDGLYYYEYFGNTFSIAPGTYPENACYEVEATARLDDGSTVVITPEDDTYRINGDITITFHFRKLPAPTDFSVRIAPYALLVAAGGCVLVVRIKKRRAEEADEA